MSKFKVGNVVVYSHALYDSVHFKLGETFKVTEIHRSGNLHLEAIDRKCKLWSTYTPDQFELVEPNPVLTPEEVFEHLRKGTKLQRQRKDVPSRWISVDHAVFVHQIDDYDWRIEPEPEVIELDGKKYREIVE